MRFCSNLIFNCTLNDLQIVCIVSFIHSLNGDKGMKAHNLLTGATLEFDRNTTAAYAVAYGYCEEKGLLPALFAACHNGGVPAFLNTLPMHKSEEHTSELQSRGHLVCRLLLEKKNISGAISS